MGDACGRERLDFAGPGLSRAPRESGDDQLDDHFAIHHSGHSAARQDGKRGARSVQAFLVDDLEEPRKTKRVFYVLYLPNQQIASWIDTVRLVLNPAEKWPAHITVRGPYKRRLAARGLERLNQQLKGNVISIYDVGRFRNVDSHVIYLACRGTKLETVWNKKDFGFNPHITLFKGSESSADIVEDLVRAIHWQFTVVSDRLEELISGTGQKDLRLYRSYDADLLSAATGTRISPFNIGSLTVEDRLNIAKRMLSQATVLPKGPVQRGSS